MGRRGFGHTAVRIGRSRGALSPRVGPSLAVVASLFCASGPRGCKMVGMSTTWRSRIRSIRVRIVVGYVVLVALAFVIVSVVGHRALWARYESSVDDRLAAEVDQLEQAIAEGDVAGGQPFDDVEELFDAHLRRVLPGDDAAFYTLVDGDPFKLSFDAPTDLLADADLVASWRDVETTTFRTVQTDAGPARVLVVPVVFDGRSATFVPAVFTQSGEDELADVFRTLTIVALVVLFVSALAALVIASRVVRPIRELTVHARSIDEADLSARIPVEGDDEVAELSATFNAMMSRLEAGFDDQRRFLDDVAHELRTPITIIQGHLDVLGDDPDESAATIALVSDELSRMNRYVNDLLVLAQAERPDFLRTAPVDVDVLVDTLFARVRALADRDWVVDAKGLGIVVLDEQRIIQAMLNLAANAVRHTEPGDEIGIGMVVDDDATVRCWVRDTGTGVEPDVLDDVFGLHVVGQHSRRSGGTGIGLPIVAAIAAAHGGEVTVESTPDVGATFTIRMPAAADVVADDDVASVDLPREEAVR